MSTLTFRIHRDSWLSANDRHHWAKKAVRTRELRHLGSLVAKRDGMSGALLGKTHVAAFIGYPRNSKADPANANPTVKALIDGMVDAGVWIDDNSDLVIGPDFRRDKPSGEAGVHTVRLVLTEQEVPF